MDFCITGGNVSDIKTAPGLTDPNKMKCLIADKAYGSKAFRKRLDSQHIKVCIPPKSNAKNPDKHDELLYKLRHIIENMFAKIKDWKGIAFRGNRCAHSFHSFVALALIFIFFNDNKA